MGLIKNYRELGFTKERKIVLDLVECALEAIQPENVFKKHFLFDGKNLRVLGKEIDLEAYKRIFLLGFGKGSAKNSSIIEKILGERLAGGFVIDVSEEKFSKIKFTLGTHPLPSAQNVEFTKTVVQEFGKLNTNDLVIIVTCGGGSALLELPTIPLEELRLVDEALLESGANIHDMNVVRKHLSKVKGGSLAEIIHPAKIVNLIFSDVPGNDLSVIASGPTVFDPTTKEDAWNTFCKFGLDKKVSVGKNDFIEAPRVQGIFSDVDNIIFLSNMTAIHAMQEKAEKLGLAVSILSDHFQGDAQMAGKELIDQTPNGSLLLAGGETTVKVQRNGEGGRNQTLVLAALGNIGDQTIICSFDSDGWDNSVFAGAIGDINTLKKAHDLNLDPKVFLNGNDSLNFFKKVGDGIETGRLPSNVSDLMIVYKK